MIHLFASDTLHHLIQTYGLWTLFCVVTLESMGLPVPGETALVATALYAGTTHGFPIESVILVAALAAIVGDNLGYMLGRWLGHRLLVRYGRYIHLSEARLQVGQYLFLRHGGKIVFFGRFVAFLRAFAALLAGANEMPWWRFLVMNGLGGICWATLFGTGAYLFGDQITAIAGPFSLILLIGVVLGIIAGILFFLHHERELEVRAAAVLSARQKHSS